MIKEGRDESAVSRFTSHVKIHLDLDVWKKGSEIVGNIYKALEAFRVKSDTA